MSPIDPDVRARMTWEVGDVVPGASEPTELVIDPPVNPMSAPADIQRWLEELRAMEVPAGQEIARAKAIGQAGAWLREARRDRGEGWRNGQG